MKIGFIIPFVRIADSKIFWSVMRFPAAVLALLYPIPKWLTAAGYAAERSGKPDRAANLYRKAADNARIAKSPESLRWLHAAEFFHHRTLHGTAEDRVQDPLFECSVKESDQKLKHPAGFFKGEFIFSGLQILGVIPESSGGNVEIFLDNIKIRELNIVPGRLFSRFSFRFSRTAIRNFPRTSNLSLRKADGGLLSTLRGNNSLQLYISHGFVSGSPLLSRERYIDKKGFMEPTEKELQEHRKVFLDIYSEAKSFFIRNLGKELFLNYGTLLGFIRQGSFIPGDDDFDVGFMADAEDPEEVKTETIDMIKELVKAGFSVSFNRRGRLFRLHGRNAGPRGPHLDLHSFWVQNGMVWAHNDFCAPGCREQYVPAVEKHFGRFKAFVPAEPEVFLSAHYGPGWKIPDPAFVNYFMDKDRNVLSNLGIALIKPAEYRECRTSLEAAEGYGEFISLAGRPLYPLPEQDEDFE